MIYINSSIEPENGEEFPIVSIALMRRTKEKNAEGEYKYTYGGSWQDREGNKKYVSGFIYNKREDSIFTLIGKICADIELKNSNPLERIMEAYRLGNPQKYIWVCDLHYLQLCEKLNARSMPEHTISNLAHSRCQYCENEGEHLVDNPEE